MTCVEVKKEALFLLTRFRKCFVRNVMTIVSISLSMGHLLRNYRRIIHLDGSWNALSYILLPLLFSCESRAHRTFLLPSLILQVVLKYEYCSELIKMLIFRYQTLHLLFIIRIIWDTVKSFKAPRNKRLRICHVNPF